MGSQAIVTGNEISAFVECVSKHRHEYERGTRPTCPTPPRLVLDDLLRCSLAQYHQEWPEEDQDLLGCVDRAIETCRWRFSRREIAKVEDAVVELVRRYHRAEGSSIVGGNCECNLPLEVTIEHFRVSTVADVVWQEDGVVHCFQWHLSRPHAGAQLVQTAINHAGLRARFPKTPIRHHAAIFWPFLTIRSFHMDDATAVRMEKVIAGITSRLRAGIDEDAPNFGVTCVRCSWLHKCAIMQNGPLVAC